MMGFLWALGGIAAGTLLAMLTGAILDYLSVRNALPESFRQWLFLPYTMGAAGLIGSIVSVSMYGRYLKTRAISAKTTVTKSGSPAGRSNVPKGMEHVPGMPTFDVDALRRERSTTSPTPTTPAAPPESRPTPPEQTQ